MKLKKQNNPLQLPLKVILNSIYGKTSQRVGQKIGNLFCPVIASTITGTTRAQLYEFVCTNNLEKQVVSFATDSVCLTEELSLDSDRLGEFSFETKADDTFYLQNGIYRMNKWKQRGLGRLGSKEIEHLDTYIRDGKLYMKFKVLRSGRLRSSILQNQISEIGRIREIEREVNLNADRKRQWFGKLTGIDDGSYNDSMPLSLNWIKKENI